MQAKPLNLREKRALVGATNLNPADFPVGSLESRAIARMLFEEMSKPPELSQYDADCLRLYGGSIYLTARTSPGCGDLAATPPYAHGEELSEQRHSPVVPSHLDPRYKRMTSASFEFERAFRRDRKAATCCDMPT